MRARKKFFEYDHNAAPLLSAINEYVASTILSLSGQDMKSISHGLYISDLMVSFSRSHFTVVDLIIYSELVEVSTLLRKQMELLARLNELHVSSTVDHLLKRTPNLSILKTHLRELYGTYSEIAHSATPQSLELLGRIVHGEGEVTSVYPNFSENAYIALQNAIMSVFEYYVWTDKFLSENCPSYDSNWAKRWLLDTIEKYKLVYENGRFRA